MFIPAGKGLFVLKM